MDAEMDDGLSNFEDQETSDFLGCALDVFRENKEALELINSLQHIYENEVQFEAAHQKFVYIFDQYQEQPQLLNPHLPGLIETLLNYINLKTPAKLLHKVFKFIYVLTKVRGYKLVLRYFPHEVTYFESTLKLLEQQDCKDHDTWETRYVLLLWFSIIVLVPIQLSRIQGKVSEEFAFSQRITNLIKNYLNVGDKARDGAAFLAAKFLTRPDVRPVYMVDFLNWATCKLANISDLSVTEVNIKAGILLALAQLFKYGKREEMKAYALDIFPKLSEISREKNCLVHKMMLKLIQRIGLTLLPARVAKWRYKRGCRSLAINLNQQSQPDGKIHGKGDAQELMEEGDEEQFEIAKEIEEILEELLKGLQAKDTIVRWSAAKGLGRISERLPQDFANDVIGSVMEYFQQRESDSAWHGACLTLAELGRRGLLLPFHLKEVVNVVLKALCYDEIKGSFSVGAHIRDAACYVLWSFARSFDPEVIEPYVPKIASGLLVASVFDREINCRRAASAAFQEHVGRQVSFPHGIDLLTKTDYQAVGSRTNCYLNVSCSIADFGIKDYTHALINHLIQFKVAHPDPAIREITAKAFHNLTPYDPSYMKEQIPKLLVMFNNVDINSRHGSISSIGEIVHALSKVDCDMEKSLGPLLNDVINMFDTLEKKKMLRSSGGEMMRIAACSLIGKYSMAAIPVPEEKVEAWRALIDGCLKQIESEVRKAAVQAINPFYTQYFSKVNPKHSRVLDLYLTMADSSSKSEYLSGSLLAIGALPSHILSSNVRKVIQTVIKHATWSKERAMWTEARRDALRTLVFICTSLSRQILDFLPNIYKCLLASFNDYTLDSRGDVGAMVREATMQSLVHITQLVVKLNLTLITKDISSKMFCEVLKQSLEKIDRTRGIAGQSFSSLLHCKPEIPHVPHRAELEEACPEFFCQRLNWSSPAHTFPVLVPLLRLPTYTASLLLGLLTSVGGLTESLIIHSRDSLFTYLASIQDDSFKADLFYKTLLRVFSENITDQRIIIPFFKTADHILTSGLIPNPSPENEDSCFQVQLVDICWKASSKSKDPQRLIAVIDVFCSLLNYDGKCQKKSLSCLAIFLCHRYPRIRKVTANTLYEAIITASFVKEENAEEVMALLSETNWDECVEYLRPLRNEICKLLEVPAPVPLGKSK